MDSKTLIDRVASSLEISKDEVAGLIETMTDIIGESCSHLDSVAVPSFGNFEPKKRLERVAVHPATGKRLLVPPKIVLSFRPSAILRKRIKESGVEE